MTSWKCNHCGNTTQQAAPPEVCASCGQRCEFLDVSCYIPDCGGPESGNINPQLFQQNSKPDKK